MATLQFRPTFTRSHKRASSVAASCSRRTSVVVAATQQAEKTSRRDVLAAGAVVVAGLAAVLPAAPAKAFLGFGEEGQLDAQYQKNTADILDKVNSVLALDRDDPTKDDRIKDLRKDINNWVATYRREPKVSGRPSFGNTYAALNALAGHYNSFGTQAPIPKKRLDRLQKELADASLFLSRNR